MGDLRADRSGRQADTESDLARIAPSQRREIVMPAYPGMLPLDLIGPRAALADLPNTLIQIAWKTTDPIRFNGLALTPTAFRTIASRKT
jgi:hypothetical protein